MRHTLLLRFAVPFGVLVALTLAACADDPATTPGAPDTAPEAEAPTPSASGGAACLVGTWQADVESVYGPDFWERIMPRENGDFAFEFAGSEGRALVTFGPDGAFRQRFEDFTVSIDAAMPMGQMRSTVAMDGTAEGTYSVHGDRLDMTPGTAHVSVTSSATMDGREMGTADLPFNDLFTSEAGAVVTFTCSGDELLVDIEVPDSEIDFEDIRYVRAE